MSPKGTNQTEGVCPGKFQNSPYGPIFLANLLERVPYVSNRGGDVFGIGCPSRVGSDRCAKNTCPGKTGLSGGPVRRTGDLSAKKCGQVPRTGPGQVTCPQKNADRSRGQVRTGDLSKTACQKQRTGAADRSRTGDLSAKKCGQVPRTGPDR